MLDFLSSDTYDQAPSGFASGYQVPARGTGYGLARLRAQYSKPPPSPRDQFDPLRAYLGDEMPSAVSKLTTGSSGQTPTYQPAQPPIRFQVDPFNSAAYGAIQGPAGVVAGLAAGQQRGGSIEGPGGIRIATAPVTAANFGTYAREGVLSLITSAMGHTYQQPLVPGEQPEGPPPGQGGPVDAIIDGLVGVGNAVTGVFDWIADRYRESQAIDRARSVRAIARDGYAPSGLIDFVTSSIFGPDKLSWAGIVAKAAKEGVAPHELLAKLWDMDPAVEAAIMNNPDMSDAELEKLAKGQPFSRDPITNMAAEVALQFGIIGAGALVGGGAGAIARGFGAGAGLAADMGGIAGGAVKIGQTAGATLGKVWQANSVLLASGATVRGGEWALKQLATWGGNQELVDTLDRWMWETPLSTNPGLNLIDAFSVHPIATFRTLRGGEVPIGAGWVVGTGGVRRPLHGGDVITVAGQPRKLTKTEAQRMDAVRNVDLGTIQTNLLDKLGWPAETVKAWFANERSELTTTDLKNSLLYLALAVARKRAGEAAAYENLAATMAERSQAWVSTHLPEALTILRDNARGSDDSIAELIRTEFWERGNLSDAGPFGGLRRTGAYSGPDSLADFVSWVRASKIAEQAHVDLNLPTETVPVLRGDVNVEAIRDYRARILASKQPNDLISASEQNLLRRYVPSIVTFGGERLMPKGEKVPRITRAQLEKILDEAQGAAERKVTEVKTFKAPTIDPEAGGSPSEIARAMRLPKSQVEPLLTQLETGPDKWPAAVPDSVYEYLRKTEGLTVDDLRTRPSAEIWQRALLSFGGKLEEARDRGVAVKELGVLRNYLTMRAGAGSRDATEVGLDASAIDSIIAHVTYPPTLAERRASNALETIYQTFEANVRQLNTDVSAILRDPARKVVLTDYGGGPFVLPEGVHANDLAVLARLIERTSVAKGLTNLEVNVLSEAGVHPFSRLAVIADLAERGIVKLTRPEQSLMERLHGGSLDEIYGGLVSDVLGPVPVTDGALADLVTRAEGVQASLDALRARIRALARVADADPSNQGVSPQLNDLKLRVTDLFGPESRFGGTNWRSLPLEPIVTEEISDLPLRQAVAYRSRLTAARASLEETERFLDRAGPEGRELGRILTRWEPTGQKVGSIKAAKEAGERLAAETGAAYGYVKVGKSRYEIMRRAPGEPEPEAPTPTGGAPVGPETIRDEASFRAWQEADTEVVTDEMRAANLRAGKSGAGGEPYWPKTQAEAARERGETFGGLSEIRARYDVVDRADASQIDDLASRIAALAGEDPDAFATLTDAMEHYYSVVGKAEGELAKLERASRRRANPISAKELAAGEAKLRAEMDEAWAQLGREIGEPTPAEPAVVDLNAQARETIIGVPGSLAYRLHEIGVDLGVASEVKRWLLAQERTEGVPSKIMTDLRGTPPPAWAAPDIPRLLELERARLKAIDAQGELGIKYGHKDKTYARPDYRALEEEKNAASQAIDDILVERLKARAAAPPAKESKYVRVTPEEQAVFDRNLALFSEQSLEGARSRVAHYEYAVEDAKRRITELDSPDRRAWLAEQQAKLEEAQAEVAGYAGPAEPPVSAAEARLAEPVPPPATDPTLGWGGGSLRGQVDPALRRGYYRKSPTAWLESWRPAAKGEAAKMIDEELALRYAERDQLAGGLGLAEPVWEPPPPLTATRLEEFQAYLEVSAKSAEETAGTSRRLDRDIAKVTRELDVKTGMSAAERKRTVAYRERLLNRRRDVDMERETLWRQRARGLRAIQHAIGTGRWNAEITSAFEQMDAPTFTRWLDEMIDATKGHTDMGIISRWFLGQQDRILTELANPPAPPAPVVNAAAGHFLRGEPEFISETGGPMRPIAGAKVVVDGTSYRVKRVAEDGTLELATAAGHWQQRSTVMTLGAGDRLTWEKADLWRARTAAQGRLLAAKGIEETAPEAPPTAEQLYLGLRRQGAETAIVDARDETRRLGGRYALADLDSLVTSDREGYPTELQIRQRGGRAALEEQVVDIANRLDPRLLISKGDRGETGPPVVLPDGTVLSGNGRTMALRRAEPARFDAYRAFLAENAEQYGLTRADVEAMAKPVLVREIAVPGEAADVRRLATALNPAGAAPAERARAIALEIDSADVAALTDVSRDLSMRGILGTPAGADFWKRLSPKLPPAMVREMVDAQGKLTEQARDLISAAAMTKLLKDERGQELVARFFERTGEDFGRVKDGLLDSLPKLLEAQSLIDDGTRYATLGLADDLAPALEHVGALYDAAGTWKQAAVDFAREIPMFDTLTPTQRWLTGAILQMDRAELRTFLRRYAQWVTESPDPNQTGMFGEIAPPERIDALRAAVRVVDEARLERWNKQLAADQQGLGLASSTRPTDGPLAALTPPPDDATGLTALTGVGERPTGDLAPEITASQHIDETTVGPEVAARIAPDEKPVMTAEPEQVASLMAYASRYLPEGQRVLWTTGDPTFDAALRSVHVSDAWDALDRDVDELVHTLGEVVTPPAERLAAFEELVASVNGRIAMGQIVPPADLLMLRHLGGGALRRLEDGSYAPTFTPAAFDDFSALYQLVSNLRAHSPHIEVGTRPVGAGDAVIIRGGHLEVPPDFTASTGLDAAAPAIEEAGARVVASGAHVIATSENRPLANAIVAAQGGATAGDGVRIIELNKPDAVRVLARAEQERMARAATVNELQAEVDRLESGIGAPNARLVDWLPEGEVRDLWSRYMNSEPGSFAAWMSEPTHLGQVVDAMESIERGVYGQLTDVEAQTLHDALWRLAEDLVAQEAKGLEAPATGAAALSPTAKRVSRRVAGKVDWNPANVPDDLERLASRIAQVVEHRDDLPPLSEYTGTQYELGLPPTKNKITGGPLPPRLFYRSLFDEAEALVPGLVDEILSERQATWATRLAANGSSSLLRWLGNAIDTIAGPRAEHDLRAQTVRNFEQELAGASIDFMNRDQYRAFRDDVNAIYRAWRKEQERQTVGPWHFPLFRRVGLMSPRLLEQKALETLSDRHGGTIPSWYGSGKTAAEAWRAADNRLRNFLMTQGPGDIGRYIASIYDTGAAKRLSGLARGVTVLYHVFRFAADLRWVAMEFVEGPFLAAGRSGPEAILNAYRPGRTTLMWGKADIERSQAAWSNWLMQTDPGAIMSIRNRYLLGALKTEQPERLIGVMKEMATNDKELAQTLRVMGDTPEQWIARLDRDFQFLSNQTKTLTSREAKIVYEPFLRDGIINQAQYDALLASGRYTRIPAIEEALKQTAGDPRIQSLYRALDIKNQELWNELAGIFFGQPDRSNLQRLMNHPLLYWPISYQLKATRWLANILFDRAFGLETGSAGAWTIQQVRDEHVKRMATDPRYARAFADNQTLLFMAQMFVPITPFDIGISLSPWTRMILEQSAAAIDPEFKNPYSRNVFGVGPGYTYFELLPRLLYEQQKPGALLFGNPAVTMLAPTFPYKIKVGAPRPTRSQLEAANIDVGTSPLQPQPPEYPESRYGL